MDFGTKVKALLKTLATVANTQTVIASVLGVVVLGGLGITGFSLYEHYYGPEAVVYAEAGTQMSTEVETQTQTEELIADATEVTETEAVTETETETETELEPVKVKLVGSSIEKDLKIKIQNEDKKNIKGEAFSITVTPDKKNAKTSTYNDHDNDGIIYISKISGGDYIVALSEIEGYYTEEDSIKVTVKEKIEYIKVEVEDEIKKEEEVSPEEDTKPEQDETVVEGVIEDTVESLESNCTPTEVAASSLNKEQYITSKASLGALVSKTLPEGTPVAVRRNIFIVGTGTQLPLTEELTQPTTEPSTVTTVSYTITHKFSDDTDGTKTVVQTESGKAVGDKITINQYEGYTSDYTGGTEYVLVEGTNELTILWTKNPEKKTVSYEITHKFSDDADGTKTVVQSETDKTVGDKITINQYEGYTSDYAGGTEYVLVEGENKLTITWTKTPAVVTVSYEITHKFSDDTDGTKTVVQSETGKAVGDKIVINQYEGYTSDYTGGTEYVLAEGENKLTIIWTKTVVTPTVLPVKVSMPGTANIFISSLGTANSATLSVTVEDSNVTKLVNASNIKWSLKDDKTAGVKLSATTGNKVTVSAKSATKEGTVTVVATIPYTVSGTEKTATLECVVTVKKDSYDATKVLTDNSGSILYTDRNCTTIAKVADLVEKGVGTFYKDPKYTGWQTLNGKLYYFNSNNQPVTGEQTISGIKYTFGPDGALAQSSTATGIDVSSWQGNIDWKAVKASGIEFAIIRVGYRGTKTGVLVEDTYFKQNIKGATEAGLKVGVYFFTQAITEAEAVEEASMVLSLTSGYNLAYPIFVDTENGSGNARANGLDKNTRTNCVAAFCKTIQTAGKKAGVYASKSWYEKKLNTDQLNNYCIWVAQYNTECTYKGRYSIWQYTETGKVPGINGNVDLNISYMN